MNETDLGEKVEYNCAAFRQQWIIFVGWAGGRQGI